MQASGSSEPSWTVAARPGGSRRPRRVDCLLLPLSWSLFPMLSPASVLKKPAKFLLLLSAVVATTVNRSPWLLFFTSLKVEPFVFSWNSTGNVVPLAGVL